MNERKKISEMTPEELEESLSQKNMIRCEYCPEMATHITSLWHPSKGYCNEHEHTDDKQQ